jgi:hypothetical protein
MFHRKYSKLAQGLYFQVTCSTGFLSPILHRLRAISWSDCNIKNIPAVNLKHLYNLGHERRRAKLVDEHCSLVKRTEN